MPHDSVSNGSVLAVVGVFLLIGLVFAAFWAYNRNCSVVENDGKDLEIKRESVVYEPVKKIKTYHVHQEPTETIYPSGRAGNNYF